jgi:phosphohistidine phosphatase
MYIFIMRHGEAEPYRDGDKSRQLTSFGTTQAEHAAKWIFKQLKELSAENEILDTAFVSPYTRTLQTLEAVKTSVSIADVQTQSMITPMGDAEDVQDYIDAYSQLQPTLQFMLIVSHMPLVSLLADKLCVGFNAKIFDTADVLLIDYDPIESKGKQVSFYQSLT